MENIEFAKELIKEFNLNGTELYLVGGSVRDYLIFNTFTDLDFATPLLPEDVKKLLKLSKIDEFASKFGTIKTNYKDHDVEITTFRKDKYLNASRHPVIEFTSEIKTDYLRRDFTINALYMNNDGIIDLCNGMEDIKNKIIRTINDPIISFRQDPLRILRCIRFANKLNFNIEENTLEAIERCKNSLEILSKEKITEELNKFNLYSNELKQLLEKFNIFEIISNKML